MGGWTYRRKISIILCEIIMSCLLLAGCGRDIKMETETFVHESLLKLQELGIDALGAEEDIVKGFSAMPDEVLEAMEQEQLLGIMLSGIGAGFYRGTEQGVSWIYAFDVEMPEIVEMYTYFLEEFSPMIEGDLEFTDIEEEISEEELEAGEGTKTVRFCCNGKAYEYKAQHYNDWFDTGMLTFLNQVIEEQNTGRHLYVTGDGYQECIVIYQTEEWAKRFRQLFDMELEQP